MVKRVVNREDDLNKKRGKMVQRFNRARGLLFGLLFFLCGKSMVVQGQSQMNLPLMDPVFQSSWENPAVRPEHRYSLGVPLLSSIEFGLISNGFTFKSVTEEKDNKLYILPDKLTKELGKHKNNMLYWETELDLLHFRFNIYDWFIWCGARTVARHSLGYDKDLVSFLVEGNRDMALEGGQIDLAFDHNLSIYNELSVGFSHVQEKWTAGFRASFLTGLINMHMPRSGVHITQSNNPIDLYAMTIKTEAQMKAAGVPVNDSTKELEYQRFGEPEYWQERSYFSNPGFALSFGGSWSPLKELNLFLSMSDIGMIHWSKDVTYYKLNMKVKEGAQEGEENTLYFPGITGLAEALRGKDNKPGESLEFGSVIPDVGFDTAAREDFTSYNVWLSPKMHFGITYDVYRTLTLRTTLGASFSGIYHQGVFYPSATIFVQQRYNTWFMAQLSYSYNQRSFANLGGALVFTPCPVQFYIATDNMLGLISPLRMKATNIRLGINFVWGELFENSPLPSDL